jgi:hypothetical protein
MIMRSLWNRALGNMADPGLDGWWCAPLAQATKAP